MKHQQPEKHFLESFKSKNFHELGEFYKDLLSTKAHLGTKNWTPDMSKYLLGNRNDISIFHLEHTFMSLRRVLKFLENQEFHSMSSKIESKLRRPHILFVNTLSKYSELVKQVAFASNQSYINDRWIGGTLTNWKQIQESIFLYKKFHLQFDDFIKTNNIQIPIYQKAKRRYCGLQFGVPNFLEKEEYFKKSKEQFQSNQNLDFNLNRTEDSRIDKSQIIPDIIVLINPDQNQIVIQEAQLLRIPIIAFADTNTKTVGINYVIPGNNKSIYFMYFCLNLITIILQKREKNKEIL